MSGKNNGHYDRTLKKIKYVRRKKPSRNNIRARLRKEPPSGDY